MKILILNGSPKSGKSNTMHLTNAFVEGMAEAGENSIETVELQKLDIKGCRGCFCCWKTTPGKCAIKDDMTELLEKIVKADMIIYSFPLYYFSVPGVMKNMIDRMLPNVLPFMTDRTDGVGSGSHPVRYDMSGKKYLIVSTCGFYSAKGNYDAVLGMFDHICGKNNYETILCGQGELFSVSSLSTRTDEYLASVRRAGREYACGGITAETRAELDTMLFPKEVFEEMADASWGISKETGEKLDESLVFTRQMAALYDPKNWDGRDRVLEISYTDLGKTYQIKLGRNGSEVFTDGSLTFTTRIDTPWQVWTDIAENKTSGSEALAKHLYRVTGDFSLMINWDKFFPQNGRSSGAESGEPAPLKTKKPLMWVMIAVWMLLWIAVPADTFVGAVIAAAGSAVMPLILAGHETTKYDRLTGVSVSALSLLALVFHTTGLWGVDTVLAGRLIPDIGYLIFGLMWLLSAFTKEPLCAAYVKYGYGGEKALSNPIFVTANRILAAAWGVLYLILAPTAFIMQSSGLTTAALILCSVAPMIMGIFTAWFEKWYPAHTAACVN